MLYYVTSEVKAKNAWEFLPSLYHLLLEKPFNMSHGCGSIPVQRSTFRGTKASHQQPTSTRQPDKWTNFVVDLPDPVRPSEDYSSEEYLLETDPTHFKNYPTKILQILKIYEALNKTINIYYVTFLSHFGIICHLAINNWYMQFCLKMKRVILFSISIFPLCFSPRSPCTCTQ